MDIPFFELIIFSNKSILPTCVPWSLLATLCLGHGLKTVVAISPLSDHSVFGPNPKTIEIITMAVFFATQSNFFPSLLPPSSQMDLALLPLLAPFHWILIRRKEDLSFCLQGYQINMNIGSSDRLGKTCRPCCFYPNFRRFTLISCLGGKKLFGSDISAFSMTVQREKCSIRGGLLTTV